MTDLKTEPTPTPVDHVEPAGGTILDRLDRAADYSWDTFVGLLSAGDIARLRAALPPLHHVNVADDDAECCIACDVPFEDGDLVYWCSDDTGHLHEDCCGPEREAYVNADGSPLKDGEPIPKPFAWRAGR